MSGQNRTKNQAQDQEPSTGPRTRYRTKDQVPDQAPRTKDQVPALTDISKSPARIATMFDAIAGRYDFLNHLLSAGLDRAWRRKAIQSLHLSAGDCVIDVCTGTADLAIAARTSSPGAARVLGIDFSQNMLQVASEKLAGLGLAPSVRLVRGDATALPAATGSADGVTVGFGIRNVEDVPGACREMHRVLKPGGRLAILELSTPTLPGLRTLYLWYFRSVLPRIGNLISRHNAAYGYLPASVGAFATPEEFVTILRQSGFGDVSAVPLTFGIVYLYIARR